MKTTTTFLAALLLAGVSQAALAQDHDHGDRKERPQAQGGQNGGQGGGAGHGGAPAAAAQPGPMAPQGGHARFGAPAPAAAPPAQHLGHEADRHFDRGGERNGVAPSEHFDREVEHNGLAPGRAPGDRQLDRGVEHFAPGGLEPGDRRFDRRDAPREVPFPGPHAERGWDREHDGHAADARQLNHNGNWDRDHRGPPPNWQHWERGRFPPIYSASHRFRISPYRPPYGWYVRAWGFNDILPRGWYGPGYWVNDFYDYDLPYPPPGYHWVRVGGDVLLVDDFTGRIAQVVRSLFW